MEPTYGNGMKTDIFRYYIYLRLRSGGRLLKELGILRSSFLTALACLTATALYQTENQWATPAICLLAIGCYHQTRKDKSFLQHLLAGRNTSAFFTKEYLLLSLPFVLLTALRSNWIIALCIPLPVCLIPHMKQNRLKRKPIRMSFLYAGNIEYIRMFRQAGWAYVLLATISLAGCIHGNMRIAKAGMLLWTLIQSGAYFHVPNPCMLMKFTRFRFFEELTWKSNAWNATVSALPFAAMLTGFGNPTEALTFVAPCLISGILYIQGMALWHWICRSEMGLLAAQIAVFIPLFAAGCFIPLFNLGGLALTGALSYIIYFQERWKH